MKKSGFFSLAIIFAILCPGSLAALDDEEILQETVRVVNVEVPVRVYFHGRPVDNLTRKDFKLYESGKKQDIHGFFLRRKKINVQKLNLNARQTREQKSRFFVLVFRFTHYNQDVQTGLDHIFDTILTESDQLLVFANDKSKYFQFLNEKDSVKARVIQLLKTVSVDARNKLLAHLNKIERAVNKHKLEMKLVNSGQGEREFHYQVFNYLEKFLEIWREYKRMYLIPDINKYYNFAQFLNRIKKEKWVINFYQFEMFPDILINSDSMRKIRLLIGAWQASDNPELITFSRLISRRLQEIYKEMSLAKDFPCEEVAKIFHNVDTTFHSIFMKTTLSSLLEDAEYREVASELENSLRAITKRTGGKLVVSNKLDQALDRIGEVEDVYYVLTFAPADPDNIGKIKVKLKNRRYKLVYSPNLKRGFLGQFLEDKESKVKSVKINDLRLEKNRLIFSITDFYWPDEEEGGVLRIHVRIEDQKGKPVFDQNKIIKATRKSIEININLNLKIQDMEKCSVVVDVNDLYTTISDTQLLTSGRLLPKHP